MKFCFNELKKKNQIEKFNESIYLRSGLCWRAKPTFVPCRRPCLFFKICENFADFSHFQLLTAGNERESVCVCGDGRAINVSRCYCASTPMIRKSLVLLFFFRLVSLVVRLVFHGKNLAYPFGLSRQGHSISLIGLPDDTRCYSRRRSDQYSQPEFPFKWKFVQAKANHLTRWIYTAYWLTSSGNLSWLPSQHPAIDKTFSQTLAIKIRKIVQFSLSLSRSFLFCFVLLRPYFINSWLKLIAWR